MTKVKCCVPRYQAQFAGAGKDFAPVEFEVATVGQEKATGVWMTLVPKGASHAIMVSSGTLMVLHNGGQPIFTKQGEIAEGEECEIRPDVKVGQKKGILYFV